MPSRLCRFCPWLVVVLLAGMLALPQRAAAVSPITVSPSPVNFPSAAIGAGTTQTLTMTNTGTAGYVLQGFGPSTADFSVTGGTCYRGGVIQGYNSSCTVTLKFTPQGAGARTATFDVMGTGPENPAAVTLTGTATMGTVTLTPTTSSFGGWNINATSNPATFTLLNGTDQPLVNPAASLSGDYAFYSPTSTTCTTYLGVGKSCTLSVNFKPTRLGTRAGTLSVTYGGAASALTSSLTGSGVGSALQFSPYYVTFPGTRSGSSSDPVTITATNYSSSAVNITGSLTTTAPGFSLNAGTCAGATIQPMATCTFTVTFTPPAKASYNANVQIPTNTGTLVVGLQGGSREILTAPTSLNFGNVAGGSLMTGGANFVNGGDLPITNITAVVTGADFSATNQMCLIYLSPGATCAVPITFKPTQIGARTGTMSVTATGAPAPAPISLTGTGTGPVIVFTQTRTDFGNVVVGSSGRVWGIQATSYASTNVTVSGAPVSSLPVVVASGSCTNATLAPGQSCTIDAKFTPTAVTAYSGTITLNTSAGAFSYPIAGTGVSSGLTVDKYALAFGSQTLGLSGSPLTVTLRNTTTSDIQVSPTAAGRNGSIATSEFSTTSSTADTECWHFNWMVPAGGTCTVSVGFTPQYLGAREGALWIYFPLPGGYYQTEYFVVDLSGTGVAGPVKIQRPVGINFSDTTVGAVSLDPAYYSVTVTNSTASDIPTVTAAMNNSDFMLFPNGDPSLCNGTLPSGQSCNYRVAFSPQAIGPRSGTLTVTAGSVTTPITFNGNGVQGPPPITVTPSTLDFGNIGIGGTTDEKAITVQNVSAADLGVNTMIYQAYAGLNGSSFYAVTNACPWPVPAGASCTQSYKFSAVGSGPWTAYAGTSYTKGATQEMVLAKLTANVSGIVNVSPNGCGFMYRDLGTPWSCSYQVENKTTGVITYTGATITPTTDFAITPYPYSDGMGCAAGRLLAVNDVCRITLTLNSLTAGARNASLQVNVTGGPSPAAVPLTGFVKTGTVTVSPSNWDFGTLPLGTSSPAQVFTIKNNSNVTLHVDSPPSFWSVTEFALQTTCTLDLALAPGDTCTATVVFTPDALGPFTVSTTIGFAESYGLLDASLSVTGSGGKPGTSPVTLSVSKAGTGTGTVTSAPAGINCGSTCSANFNPGTSVTLTAAPLAGSSFAGWSGGGCSGTGNCAVTLNSATYVTATFNVIVQKSLTVTKGGNGGTGTVTTSPAGIDCGSTCSANFNVGTSITITAAADAGSTFDQWSGAGCTGSTATTCTFTITDITAVVASFNLAQKALYVSKAGTGSGTVTSAPAGINCGSTCWANFATGASVTLTAAAGTGATFTGWSGSCTGTGTCTVTMNANTYVTANFDDPTITTVSMKSIGSGKVTSSPAGIDCGKTCNANFAKNSTVTFTAIPDPGAAFAGWSSGGCTGTSLTCVLTLDGPKNITANFSSGPQLTVIKTGAGAGVITSAPAGIDCGPTCSAYFTTATSVTLTPKAFIGSTFMNWLGGGCSGNGTCTAQMNGAITLQANFSTVGSYQLTVTKDVNIPVTSVPAGINCGGAYSSCTANFAPGTRVTLSAGSMAGVLFNRWSGAAACANLGANPACTLTMDNNYTITANYIGSSTSNVLVVMNGTGSGKVAGGGVDCPANYCSFSYAGSANVPLTATANTGSTFKGWSGGGCSGTGSCTLNLNGNTVTVTATFDDPTTQLPLSVTKAGTGAGRVTSSPAGIDCGPACTGNFAQNASVTLTAAPVIGATFKGWGGACTGTGTCTVTMNAAQNVTATFDAIAPEMRHRARSRTRLTQERVPASTVAPGESGAAGTAKDVRHKANEQPHKGDAAPPAAGGESGSGSTTSDTQHRKHSTRKQGTTQAT